MGTFEEQAVLWNEIFSSIEHRALYFRLLLPAMKLAVELDGGQHNQSENKEHEAFRSEYLKMQGIEIMRFWNCEVLLDMESVLSELEQKVTPLHPPLS